MRLSTIHSEYIQVKGKHIFKIKSQSLTFQGRQCFLLPALMLRCTALLSLPDKAAVLFFSLFVVYLLFLRRKATRGGRVTACRDAGWFSPTKSGRVCKPADPRGLRCPSATEGERRIWLCHSHLKKQTSSWW